MRRVVAAVAHTPPVFTPFILGFGIWIGFPTVAAYQDMAALVSGMEASAPRWNSYVEKSAAGSIHAAEMPFIDSSSVTGSIAGAGMTMPGVGAVAFRGKGVAADIAPDEDRVMRAQKRGRIVKVAPVAPPKSFNAGSVFDRTSSILRPTFDLEEQLAFTAPFIKGREIEIAAAFHLREDKPAEELPTMVAELINNDTPDILAAAYAPADYSKASPFESLLRNKDAEGRFIPPMAQGDHDWMQNPLPATVFTKPEQTCLATAIYFEARGEEVKGQAAVAQVILNRVRNPSYPDTICGVVYQNDSWKNRCQFSFACDGKKDRITSPRHYQLAEQIAMEVTAGRIFLPEIGSSTHYYAEYVSPKWAQRMNRMKQIGLHIFYRTKGGGWS
ncbi:MAG: cell wall hydrolase [Rhizobiaceae bacterium]|nr:cell wall hydrolase [Rhizobiaceae bacterium]